MDFRTILGIALFVLVLICFLYLLIGSIVKRDWSRNTRIFRAVVAILALVVLLFFFLAGNNRLCC